MKVPVLVLFGPTASGKTALLGRLFGKQSCSENDEGSTALKAEIISADSMQVYRGMDIGTAKPSGEDRKRIPHHLIDIRNPSEQFNAGDFVRLAEEACLAASGRGALPVVSGGTAFYLKNLVLGLSEAPPSDRGIRLLLKEELVKRGAASLMEELAASDPVSAGRIHINDEYRLLRALEVFRLTGRPLSSFASPWNSPGERKPVTGKLPAGPGAVSSLQRGCPMSLEKPLSKEANMEEEALIKNLLNFPCEASSPWINPEKINSLTAPFYFRGDFCFRLIGLRRSREELYSRINERTAGMFNAGLPGEVKRLFEAGYSPDDPGLRAIGYREFFFREGGAGPWRLSEDLAGVEALVARNSRRYAKRQITFFSSLPGVMWIDCTEERNLYRGFKPAG